MVKVGGLYWAQTALFKPESRFARLKVTRLWQERLEDISNYDAKAEGYESVETYLGAFLKINHISLPQERYMALSQQVYCVEFEVNLG